MAQTSLLLQIIAVVINVLGIIFLVIATALFGNGYRLFNNEQNGDDSVCFLYFRLNVFTYKTSNNSICVFSIVAEVLAALGLVILLILSIVKLVRELIGNKNILIFEILILLFSGIFALIAAIILSSGWGVTCDTIKDINRLGGISYNCNTSYLKQITTSVVFAAFAVVAIVGSSVFSIIIAVLGQKENKKLTK